MNFFFWFWSAELKKYSEFFENSVVFFYSNSQVVFTFDDLLNRKQRSFWRELNSCIVFLIACLLWMAFYRLGHDGPCAGEIESSGHCHFLSYSIFTPPYLFKLAPVQTPPTIKTFSRHYYDTIAQLQTINCKKKKKKKKDVRIIS